MCFKYMYSNLKRYEYYLILLHNNNKIYKKTIRYKPCTRQKPLSRGRQDKMTPDWQIRSRHKVGAGVTRLGMLSGLGEPKLCTPPASRWRFRPDMDVTSVRNDIKR